MEPITDPMRIPEQLCGWCNLRLNAIPDDPRQIEPNGRYYHPIGCISAARFDRAGGVTSRTDTAPMKRAPV